MKPFVMMMSVFVMIGTGIAAEPESSEKLRERIAEEFRWIREEAVVVTASQKAQKISEAPATIVSIAYLNLTYRLDKHLAVDFSVDNVFDTEHYCGVPSDGSPVVVPRTTQPLRGGYLGLGYSF